MTKGGTRPGAGRPQRPEPMHRVTVRLTEKQRGTYFDLGGTIWLRRVLDESDHSNGVAKRMLSKHEKTKGTK